MKYPADHADYGPGFVRIDGRVVAALPTANVLELGERPDPDAPRRTIRGARRRDTVAALYRTGAIAEPLYDAATRLRDDAALAEGVRDQTSVVRGGADYHRAVIARLDAQTRVRLAWLAIRGVGNDVRAMDVVRCVVLAGCALETYDRGRRVRHGTARGSLALGLERLAEHYGL